MASSEAAAAMKMSNNNPLMVVNQQQQHPAPSMEAAPPAKKKRNLPGTPDPDAEVIALSPGALLATNRFVCEICGKGFQRDQNLQLHRRGHNLPWKLRQRSGKEPPRKRVYVCPEKSCVHHNPARALGDLTGIKKHFCRKHGEKKWKCEKCSKKYAVQSDWKAHSKTCGTREYRCDCGTLFSRRDSFITHRAFCDALAQETARHQLTNNHHHQIMQQHYYLHNTTVSSSVFGAAEPPPPPPPMAMAPWHHQSDDQQHHQLGLGRMGLGMVPSLFSSDHQQATTKPADMSATALLQKAAQIGAVTSSSMAIMGGGACCSFDIDDDKHHQPAGLVFGGTQHHQQNNVAAAASFDDVLSAVRHATGLNNLLKDAAVASREETRDFLGVGVQQALCSSSLPLHGWI